MSEISKLIEILKEEESIYKKILELANSKTEMIAEENIDQIETVAKEEEAYIQEAKLVEYKREDQITLIEKTLDIKISDISSLSPYIKDQELKNELLQTQERFSQTLNELKRVNMVNNTLIQDALEYIALSLNLMSGATAEGTYGKDAEESAVQTQNKSMFDFKG